MKLNIWKASFGWSHRPRTFIESFILWSRRTSASRSKRSKNKLSIWSRMKTNISNSRSWSCRKRCDNSKQEIPKMISQSLIFQKILSCPQFLEGETSLETNKSIPSILEQKYKKTRQLWFLLLWTSVDVQSALCSRRVYISKTWIS